MSFLPYVVVVWLFVIGLYGIVTSRHLVHMVVSLSVVQSATYVLLLAIGYRRGATAPVFAGIPVGSRVVDPVVQALCLTDVVVAATTTAFLLGLVLQTQKRFGTVDPNELGDLRD